jgi:putative addiction module component (TIGR02574 family)
MTKDQIIAEARKLDLADLEDVVEELLGTLPEDRQAFIDAAWLQEAKRRDAAFEAGEVTASPVEEVLTRILSKARK